MNYFTQSNSPHLVHVGFLFMSIQELLKLSGVEYHRQDAFNLGLMIMSKAKEKKVKWVKKQEMVEVNDFPDDFLPEMQETLIKYFSSKNKDKK